MSHETITTETITEWLRLGWNGWTETSGEFKAAYADCIADCDGDWQSVQENYCEHMWVRFGREELEEATNEWVRGNGLYIKIGDNEFTAINTRTKSNHKGA